ncbi:hypothetical protein [Streptomyces sp. NPDC059442]|uniref:hypothetical protein n=1 Tax=unclassified Streptomyces TaxID=2593676 RepID=UPI00368537D9
MDQGVAALVGAVVGAAGATAAALITVRSSARGVLAQLHQQSAQFTRQSLGAAEYASIEFDFRTDFRAFTEACNRALDDEGSGSVS